MSDPVEMRRQVWHSLISMVQVYAHAAGLRGKPYTVTSTDSTAAVNYEDASLAISFTPEQGVGEWKLIQGAEQEQGGFAIDEHGALQFPKGAKDLDMAALDWMDWLAQLSHVNQPEQVKP